jgi:hypothetical protein
MTGFVVLTKSADTYFISNLLYFFRFNFLFENDKYICGPEGNSLQSVTQDSTKVGSWRQNP